MNRVEKVSIGGVSFVLDAEAYPVLKKYIGELESYYIGRQDGREVMESIEERLAELLFGQLEGREIVTRQMADAALKILGRPDIIEGITDQEKNEGAKAKKKLFRDTDHRIVGGVCSGLAARFGIDAVILRLIWVAAFLCGGWLWWHSTFGGIQTFAILSYIVLWICMPAARSGQLYRLKKNESHPSEFWQAVGTAIRIVMGILLILTGAFAVLGGITALIGSTFFGFADMIQEWGTELFDEMPVFASAIRLVWVRVLAGLAFFLPFLGMLYGGVMMTFNLKAPKWHPGLVIAAVWLAIVIILTLTVISSIIPSLM